MDYFNIGVIASYNIRLLLREKLLWCYTLGVYVVILFAQLSSQSILMRNSSDIADFSSSVPFMNVFFFLVFQTLPLVILGCHFLYKGRGVDSMEAIYYRSESNAEYVYGMFVAFISVFGGAAIFSLLMVLLVHLLFMPFPLGGEYYLFYLFLMVIPALVFMIGFSFFVVTWIRNRVLSVIFLLGFLGTTIFYLSDCLFGLFDPLGLSLPSAFSRITGHSDIWGYFLQRGMWFFLGLSFVGLTILKFDRIPNRVSCVGKRVLVLFFLIIGIVCGGSFFFLQQNKFWERLNYRSIYEKYSSYPKAYLESQDVDYEQRENEMFVNTKLVVRNRTGKDMSKVLLYLNPGLDITALSINGMTSLFEREKQVIIVPASLSPGDSLLLELSYKGQIDERICYLNVPDVEIADTRKRMYLACRLGKRYSYLRKDFTLLIPEVLWYPTTVPPENPNSPYDNSRNFTRYSLRVRGHGKNKVISQGMRKRNGDQVIFRNEHLLHGITLNIGDYITRQLTVDSVTYELHMWRKHAALLKILNDRLEPSPDQKVSSTELIIRHVRHIAEISTGRKYPYKRFQLVETPLDFTSYFRDEMKSSGFVQPEVLYFPERGFRMKVFFSEVELAVNSLLFQEDKFRNTFSWDGILRWNVLLKRFHLEDGVFDKNPYLIRTQFYNQISDIICQTYPFFNSLVNLIIEDNNQTRIQPRPSLTPILEQQAIDYLRSHSLKDALYDHSLNMAVLGAIFVLKERELVDIFQTKGVDQDSLVSFLMNFLDRHRFNVTDFEQLNEEFKSVFHVDWNTVLPSWYARSRIPTYLLKITDVMRVKTENPKDLYSRIEFAIFNDSDVDGVVNIRTSTYLPGGWAEMQLAHKEKRRESTIKYQAFKIEAKTGKRFALVVGEFLDFMINTNIAGNLPNSFFFHETGIFTQDTSRYIEEVSRRYFLPDTNVFIVDNTDPGCKLTQPSTFLKLVNNDHLMSPKSWIRFINFKEGIFMPSSSWKEFLAQDCQGTTVRSFVFTRGGAGDYRLTWEVDLPKEGEYEAFVYIPSYSLNMNIQKYRISPLGDEEKVVSIDTKGKWCSLGIYNCLPGISKISLSNEGEENQMIIGDAVKWVYQGKAIR